ncbi:MAG TPA: flagellar assembly protein FliW [Bryobacteraceae bacterium]|nr:flagellar assembly protein FliW [Bryobacteraceae bacterium]
MAVFETTNFGTISFGPESAIEFPAGLPAFEDCRRFAAVRLENSDPLLFLQSLERPDLCFVTVPVFVIDPHYRLDVKEEDLELVSFPAGRRPRIGEDIACLAVLSFRDTGATANLLAPLLVNLRNLKAVQAVTAAGYSHQHPLPVKAPNAT